MEKWSFEYKLNAGCDVPVRPEMSDKEILYAIDDYVQDHVNFGNAEYDDTSEYDLLQNDDGTMDAHVRLYATYFIETYGKDKEDCERAAREQLESEDFGDLTQDDEFHYELYNAEQQMTMVKAVVSAFQDIQKKNEQYLNPNNEILNRGFLLVRPEDTAYIILARLNYNNKVDLTFYEAPDYENECMYSESSDYGKQKMDYYCHDDNVLGSEANVSLGKLESVLIKAIGMEEYDSPKEERNIPDAER